MRSVRRYLLVGSNINIYQASITWKEAILDTSVRHVLRAERMRVGKGRRARSLSGQGEWIFSLEYCTVE